MTIECIKTAVFDTRNPKSPYPGSPPTPTPLLGRYAPSTRGQFTPSLSYLPLFSNISCLMPDTVYTVAWAPFVLYPLVCQKSKLASGWLCQKWNLVNKELIILLTDMYIELNTNRCQIPCHTQTL